MNKEKGNKIIVNRLSYKSRLRLRLLLALLFIILISMGALSGCGYVMPNELKHEEIREFLKKDEKLLEKFTIPVNGSITLYDAMARTVLANLDYRVQELERAFANNEFEKACLDLLPRITAQSSYISRTPQYAAISKNLQTGYVSTGGYTTSEEKNHFSGDIRAAWNLLDLGLSYYQAKQQMDAVLVRKEIARSVLQELIFKVRNAYWKAYFAQYFEQDFERLQKGTDDALDKIDKIDRERLMPREQLIEYKKTLFLLKTRTEEIMKELRFARLELMALMNIPVADKIRLIAPANVNEPPKLDEASLPSLKDMFDVALDLRPEMRKSIYHTRVSAAEVKKAWIKMLPGIEVRAAFQFDTNMYLKDNQWFSLWGNIIGNIIDLLNAPMRIGMAKTEAEIAEYRRLGVHLTIMMQVQMALRQYVDAVRLDNMYSSLSKIDDELYDLELKAGMANAGNPMKLIRKEAAAYLSRLSHYKAYAEMQNAYGRMLNSLGIDLVPELDPNMPYYEMVDRLKMMRAAETRDLREVVNEAMNRIKTESAEE